MALPQRVFFTLHEASARWGCSIADIAGWAAVGKLKIMTGIGLVRCGDADFAGRVPSRPWTCSRCFGDAALARSRGPCVGSCQMVAQIG